jgi:zinc transporter ZupT
MYVNVRNIFVYITAYIRIYIHTYIHTYIRTYIIVFFNWWRSKADAISAQFLTAVAAVAGTAVGLYAERNKAAEEMLLALTAGGFL